MPDELKRATAPGYQKATRSPARAPGASKSQAPGAERDADAVTGERSAVGWFEAISPDLRQPLRPSRRWIAAGPLVALAAAIAVFARDPILRVALPCVLGLAAVLMAMEPLRGRRRRRRREPRRGLGLELLAAGSAKGSSDGASSASVSLDASTVPGRLLFKAPGGERSQTLLTTSEPFGVTLVSTASRDRAALSLTSAKGTFYVGATFDLAARQAFGGLLERAFTVARDEAGLDAIGPDGEPVLLAPDAFASLLGSLVSLDGACVDRLVLTDARGAPLLLSARELRVGDRVFDLDAPLSWRGIVFQESFGAFLAVYEGTWIRQGSSEVVLVSLLSSLSSGGLGGVTGGSPLSSLDRSVVRDLRLMQGAPEMPPPHEQRVAIDRLFMLPVRCALDRAPRASREPSRVRA